MVLIKIKLKSIEKNNIIVEQACGICLGTARFPSGQRGWTVNPSAMPSLVRIQSSPPFFAKASNGTAIFFKSWLDYSKKIDSLKKNALRSSVERSRAL